MTKLPRFASAARSALTLVRTSLVALMCGGALACRPPAPMEKASEPKETTSKPATSTASPWNATYLLDGQPIELIDGRASLKAAPGLSATMEIERIGEAVLADLDQDGDADAVLIVRQASVGSGSFYYVAAAREESGSYRGLNFVLIGDRIAVEEITVRRGVVVLRLLTRRADEPMSSPPSISRLAFTTLEEGVLRPLVALEEGEQLLEAMVTVGHEVRTIRPCGGQNEAWISGASPALPTLLDTHRRETQGQAPYTPVLMLLTGRMQDARDETGFGADYHSSFIATRLLRSFGEQHC